MKQFLVVIVVVAMASSAFGGGILTNTNQSAQFIRTLSRNASTAIDATYFNPAGLTKLDDGWHFAFHNQSVFQERTVTNGHPLLNNDDYVGKLNVPFFPNFYAVYKQEKFAVSFGFGPNAGGGSAEYESGLPSFEAGLAKIPAMVTQMGVPTSGYKADMYFKGQSVFYGIQLNASYAISDVFSAAIGGRYIMANNTYEGYIRDIQINPNYPAFGFTGNYMSAEQFFNALASVNPAAGAYAAMVGDKKVDSKQTGTAITPIVSLNVKPIEALNIGVKYEFKSPLELTNETEVDDTGEFPDGVKTQNDIPAIFALGADYAFAPQFRASLSFNYYFDKDVDWDGREELVDNNYIEIGVGAEYDLSEVFALSIGFLHSQPGVSEDYQNDISHSLNSNTVGLGFGYALTSALDFDFGILYGVYDESVKTVADPEIGASFEETYNRTNFAFALGLGYHF